MAEYVNNNFINETIGNITDTIENFAYKMQTYVDVLTKRIPIVCDTIHSNKDQELYDVLKFFIIEHENIIYNKGICLIHEIDSAFETKNSNFIYNIIDHRDSKYRISKEKVEVFNSYLNSGYWYVKESDLFDNTKEFIDHLDMYSYVRNSINHYKENKDTNIEYEDHDAYDFTEKINDAYHKIRKLLWHYRNMIVNAGSYADVLIILTKCFDMILNLYYVMDSIIMSDD